ncbi:DNA mismatch repair protein [Nymphaea thermarum]|nr:DNA mismatch repair protein [Nymphaea thermarum]
MAPSRRLSNGATPTAAKQRSITSFFSSGSNAVTRTPPPSASPKPSLVIPSPPQTTSPEPSSSPRTAPPSKPSSVEPSPSSSRHGEGVVGWRIRVFWPLDDQWYEGHVKSFNASTGKHLIQYDDGEEEALDLERERFQWAEVTPLRSFRRLRRISSGDGSYNGDSLAKRIEDEISEEGKEEGGGGDGDNAEDEDWDKDGSGEDKGGDSVKGSKGGSAGSRKRKNAGSIRSGSDSSVTQKKSVRVVGLKDEGKRLRFDVGDVSPREKEKTDIAGLRGSTVYGIETAPVKDVAERFGRREMEKFEFLGKGRRDANGRKPGDEYYDPRTLKLPNDFLKSLSAGQRQWWQFKSKHMDKVLFFKMGKFYELFEMDAHIAFKELDLQYMKGEQPHCGFPERNFAMNVEKLAMKGYRVLVVEQTETPDQLELRRKEMGSKDKVVKREICAVITKGTLVESEMLSTNADVSYLMSVTESCKPTEGGKDDTVTLGICIADVSTSKFMLGQMLSRETEKVLLDNTRNPLVNNLIPDIEFWDAHRTLFEARRVYELSTLSRSLSESKVDISSTFDVVDEDTDLLPEVLTELENAAESGQHALSAFGGCLFYLRQALLDTSLLRCARFEFLPCPGFLDISKKSYMTLDASALENLEIFENNSGSSSGTLFAQLDYCVTPFGKRLLKNWLARPLCDAKSILERQHAITDLKHVAFDSVLEFRKMLSKVPDMERLLARLFANSEASGRNATKVVLYEDAAKKQLHEFITALRGCQMMVHSCALFSNIQDDLTSTTLQCLLTGDCFLDIEPVLMHFKDAFDWTEAEHTGRIIPHEGVDVEYDSSCKAAAEIETNLIRYLKEQRKLLGDSSVAYVTVGKDRYVLEVPEDLQGRIPTEYQLHSSKKGYFRYWTPQIRAHLGELSNAEAERESKLKSILQRFIIRFCDHHLKLRQLISVIAELDALSSLAVASDYYEGPVCRPTILGSSCSKGTPSLSGKCLGHPILKSDAMGKGSFVPNDVNIGGTNNASFVLLTGPNMGGKSTLLRQIGAYVPGESFELSPVDRIFVRMGAKDHIMAGQSTFLTELSETATMLLSATHNSLVALDELGRGTSTSDGQAIAESVLDHFIQKIGCRGMFSTHYHRLAVKYENDSQVGLFHMACQVEKRVDGIEEVTFLYKLTPGACPRSYGVNVACLADVSAESTISKV